jgi:hypothetical protein
MPICGRRTCQDGARLQPPSAHAAELRSPPPPPPHARHPVIPLPQLGLGGRSSRCRGRTSELRPPGGGVRACAVRPTRGRGLRELGAEWQRGRGRGRVLRGTRHPGGRLGGGGGLEGEKVLSRLGLRTTLRAG